MRLHYNVLWIDDKPASLRRHQNMLREFNEEIGVVTNTKNFAVKMSARETPDEHKTRISSELQEVLKNSVFELIVVDLHMTGGAGGLDGHDIIEFIRDTQKIFRPIVFHSAGEPVSDEKAQSQLNAQATESGIFGKSVFITTRNKLNATLKDIAGEMHEHEHQVNQVRGTLMDCVSEIDAQIIQIVMGDGIWEKLPDDKKNKALKVFKGLAKSSFNKASRYNEAVQGMSYDDVRKFISGDPKNVTTFSKAKLLRELAREIPELSDEGDVLSSFLSTRDGEADCLTDVRNAYAHQTAEVLSQKHDKEHCTYIRREAHRHRTNIEQLKKKL